VTRDGTFRVYSRARTRGFYIKVYWRGEELYGMDNAYPPRLKVARGQLRVISTYWLISEARATAACVRDHVTVTMIA